MSTAELTQEIELKLSVAPAEVATLKMLLARFGPLTPKRIDTTYFDTPTGDLAARHAVLRLRRVGRRYMQTFKTGDGEQAMAARGEIELPVSRAAIDLRALMAAGAPDWLGSLDFTRLRPSFRTVFERAGCRVNEQGSLIDLALDLGRIEVTTPPSRSRLAPPQASAPIAELELELVSGQPEALFAFVERLVQSSDGALTLLPLPASKALRGERLARGEPALQPLAASREVFARVGAGTSSAAVLRAVAGLAANIVTANLHCLDGPQASLAIHQARVALRRLRSAVRLLADDADFPEGLRGQTAWLARALGRARDLDVLVTNTWPQIERFLAQLDSSGALAGSASQLEARIRAAAAEARGELLQLRMRPETGQLLRALLAFAASPVPADSPRLTPARAVKVVQRRCERLLKAGRKFATLEPEAQHRVRILGKRARYAVELLAPHLPRRRGEKLGRALARLQERLGLLNDAEVALPILLSMVDDTALAKALIDWRYSLRAAYVEEAERELKAVREALPLD
ncbi:MAG: CHAD domain-containing protein [Casimicrobiaceae bacterium]|nr:CHAD domain-containing protein [Casimicrobiaceae bacterium]MDW8312432.1 CHAD domain-containing protein [Burkholderiales bacterium]